MSDDTLTQLINEEADLVLDYINDESYYGLGISKAGEETKQKMLARIVNRLRYFYYLGLSQGQPGKAEGIQEIISKAAGAGFEVSPLPGKPGYFRVKTPFWYGDGDSIMLYAIDADEGVVLTDLGDLRHNLGTRFGDEVFESADFSRTVQRVYNEFNLVELMGCVTCKPKDLSTALFSLIQGMLRIEQDAVFKHRAFTGQY